jgi:hypothetical protein
MPSTEIKRNGVVDIHRTSLLDSVTANSLPEFRRGFRGGPG